MAGNHGCFLLALKKKAGFAEHTPSAAFFSEGESQMQKTFAADAAVQPNKKRFTAAERDIKNG